MLRYVFSSVQFSSVTQSCLTLCDPMNRSPPGLPVHHQLPEFTQTHEGTCELGQILGDGEDREAWRAAVHGVSKS